MVGLDFVRSRNDGVRIPSAFLFFLWKGDKEEMSKWRKARSYAILTGMGLITSFTGALLATLSFMSLVSVFK